MTMSKEKSPRNPATWLYVLTITLFLFMAGWGALLGFDDPERALRTTGGILQLLGLLGIGIGLKRKHDEHSTQSMSGELLQELRGIWASSSRNYTVTAEGFGLITIMGKGRGRVMCGEGASVEQRLKRLEENFEHLDDAFAALDESLDKVKGEWEKALKAEASLRARAESTFGEALERLAVGDIKLESAGWLWMLLGTFLATWSSEIGSVVTPWFAK